MSDECFVHVIQMQERWVDHAELLDDTSRMLKTYEVESVGALASGDLERMMGGFSRFMFAQLPALFEQFSDERKSSIQIMELALAAIRCTVNEPKPISTAAPAPAAPLDQDWLDGVLVDLDEPTAPEAPLSYPPVHVILGADCGKPLTVSLPDNVLTECE